MSITISRAHLATIVSGATGVDIYLLAEDQGFRDLLNDVAMNATYTVAIESLTSYVQDNY